ncbi:MAG: hypothetical protein KBC95_00425 [Candidatus Peribacteraceae bacterium]|nr:hypothetical protein [Candidatus Peribacteraceae bacterium]
MNTLLSSIVAAALLSTTSLLTVMLRVSPISAPEQALPAFFLSVFLSASSIATLLLAGAWRLVPTHTWDFGKLLSISLREGLFVGTALVILLVFHLLTILTWWVAVLVIVIFLLVELALHA